MFIPDLIEQKDYDMFRFAYYNDGLKIDTEKFVLKRDYINSKFEMEKNIEELDFNKVPLYEVQEYGVVNPKTYSYISITTNDNKIKAYDANYIYEYIVNLVLEPMLGSEKMIISSSKKDDYLTISRFLDRKGFIDMNTSGKPIEMKQNAYSIGFSFDDKQNLTYESIRVDVPMNFIAGKELEFNIRVSPKLRFYALVSITKNTKDIHTGKTISASIYYKDSPKVQLEKGVSVQYTILI